MNNDWNWKKSPELMARLREAQNHRANENVDIMTFAGFCESAEQLEQHVAYYERRANAGGR